MPPTFEPSSGDTYLSSASQIAATQTATLNLDGTLTVTKDADASTVSPFITSIAINNVAFGQHVSVSYGGSTVNAIATTYDTTVVTGFGTFAISAVLLGTDGTHALLGATSFPGGGVIVSTSAQVFGDGLSDTFTPAFTLACFAAGTRIDTPDGPVPVEALREGQPILSAFGGTVPVVWIGHRSIDCRRHPRPEEIWPVRIQAGAFGPGLPRRDLLLSPDHAIHADGALVPVRYLVNGATIAQVPVERITYFHVEAPAHDVLLAEGLPAETYLDTGNRAAFANGGTTVMAHADFALAVWRAEGCAPLVTAGPALAALRARLLARAEALGHRLSDAPDLAILAAGRALRPCREGGTWVCDLPPGTGEIRLRSRASVPAHVLAASDDHRRLGIAVAAIRIDGAALPPAARRDGWHAPESDATGAAWQWTDGDASLAARPGRLEIDVALAAPAWITPPRTDASRAGAPPAARRRA